MTPYRPLDSRGLRPPRLPNFLLIVLCATHVGFHLWLFGQLNHLWESPWGVWTILYALKTCIEVVASIYAFFYALVALTYRPPTVPRAPLRRHTGSPTVGAVYLCCDDLDIAALRSIATAASHERMCLWVHDDSTTAAAQAAVNRAVAQVRHDSPCNIVLVRRPTREGGKPGALNHLVQHLPADIAYLLLCDSDSFLLDAHLLARALPYFDDPAVALVQCRTVGYVTAEAPLGYHILSLSITFYDAFVTFMARHGWPPFLGHNAFIRVAALTQVGGFTPGQLADDIDLSIKLRLAGYTLRYARDIVCGERHPLTYDALRRRTAKWTYGCTQVVLRWGWSLLTSSRIALLDRTIFFLTVGYYPVQTLLLFYLIIVVLILPWHEPLQVVGLEHLVAAGLILLLTFVPSITYFAAAGTLRAWPRAAMYWGLAYGSQELVILRALCRCLLHRPLAWVPTNTVAGPLGHWRFLPEFSLGVAIVALVGALAPSLLLCPTTWLFAGKFLLTPVLNRWMFRVR